MDFPLRLRVMGCSPDMPHTSFIKIFFPFHSSAWSEFQGKEGVRHDFVFAFFTHGGPGPYFVGDVAHAMHPDYAPRYPERHWHVLFPCRHSRRLE